MEIIKIAGDATLDTEDLVTVACNLVQNPNASSYEVYVEQKAAGFSAGTTIGGDADPVLEVQPNYIGKSVMGARVACILTDLSWMRNNCSVYEFFALYEDSVRGTQYFVSGVLNVTADEAYDPFNSSQATGAPTTYAVFTGLGGEMFPG